VHSRGGIGNQLFILGAGLALADELDCRLYVDPSQHRYTPHLPYLVEEFLSGACPELVSSIVSLDEPSTALSRAVLRGTIPRSCTLNESTFAYETDFFLQRRGSCLLGYFQSWHYLNRLSAARQEQIRFTILSKVEATPLWGHSDIVLHVRRGDYLKPEVREIHGVLCYGYYIDAVNKLRELGFDGQVWAVVQNPLDDGPIWSQVLRREVKELHGSTIWHDLSALMSAPSLAIANSTFSWLGGWFGDQSRPIVAPAPWFRTSEIDTRDLIPPWWLTGNHEFD
jgi:hypothetical protein